MCSEDFRCQPAERVARHFYERRRDDLGRDYLGGLRPITRELGCAWDPCGFHYERIVFRWRVWPPITSRLAARNVVPRTDQAVRLRKTSHCRVTSDHVWRNDGESRFPSIQVSGANSSQKNGFIGQNKFYGIRGGAIRRLIDFPSPRIADLHCHIIVVVTHLNVRSAEMVNR